MKIVEDGSRTVTALSNNTQTLKFKSQLTFLFSAAVNHLNRPLTKQKDLSASSKVHGWWFVIGGFRSILSYFLCFKVCCL